LRQGMPRICWVFRAALLWVILLWCVLRLGLGLILLRLLGDCAGFNLVAREGVAAVRKLGDRRNVSIFSTAPSP
jgi:hypothetical protein